MMTLVDKGMFGGNIYSAIRDDKRNRIVFKLDLADRVEEFSRFVAKSNSTAQVFTKYLQTSQNNNQTVGIYVPGRAVNILATIKEEIPLTGLRFFDDNNCKAHFYLDSIYQSSHGMICLSDQRIR
jgi:hypothetical protein